MPLSNVSNVSLLIRLALISIKQLVHSNSKSLCSIKYIQHNCLLQLVCQMTLKLLICVFGLVKQPFDAAVASPIRSSLSWSENWK